MLRRRRRLLRWHRGHRRRRRSLAGLRHVWPWGRSSDSAGNLLFRTLNDVCDILLRLLSLLHELLRLHRCSSSCLLFGLVLSCSISLAVALLLRVSKHLLVCSEDVLTLSCHLCQTLPNLHVSSEGVFLLSRLDDTTLLLPLGIQQGDTHMLRHLCNRHLLACDGRDHVGRRALSSIRRRRWLGVVLHDLHWSIQVLLKDFLFWFLFWRRLSN
mmetsp:Transcript_9384/g.31397  ORF Transcript_9384/g.31397 Transcript_9384/m.31397 type:complete len:213 (-) Transcript_9384:990-1628(-)